jgi:hypothetical protein
MKFLTVLSLVFFLVLSSCGPAAEDRQQMHSRARVFQDSMANLIIRTMNEAGEQVRPFSDSAKVNALKPAGQGY